MGVWMHKQIPKMKIQSQNTDVIIIAIVEFVVVQPFSHVQLFAIPWAAARQASLSFTISWSLLKLMSIESGTPSNHVILCRPLLLPPSIFPSIRIFSHESALHIRWPKLWSFSFSISPSSEYSGWFPLGWTDLFLQCFSWISRINVINYISSPINVFSCVNTYIPLYLKKDYYN